MTGKIRIIHIINSFEFGGAESMLCNLLLRTDRDRFAPSVVSLINDLTVAKPILDAGIPLVTMGIKPSVPDPRGLVKLANHLRDERPDVVQTWMDHSNLIGGAVARASSGARVIWGIHHADHVAGMTKRSTLATVWSCAKLSRRVPDGIVYCSEHARTLYERRGFAGEKAVVIPNGFDSAAYRPDDVARRDVRTELDIREEVPLIGLAARYDPVKDHATFLQAAAKLVAHRPNVRFLLCGHKVDRDNPELVGQIRTLGLESHCQLLGARRDMARIYAALDVVTSSSVSEAFPLVVGEAMSCGVPCVVTDVGDSALIVGDTGHVVPPRDPAAMSNAWDRILGMDAPAGLQLGRSARRRVLEHFDLSSVTRRYESLYELKTAGDGARRSRARMPGAPREKAASA